MTTGIKQVRSQSQISLGGKPRGAIISGMRIRDGGGERPGEGHPGGVDPFTSKRKLLAPLDFRKKKVGKTNRRVGNGS